MLKSIPKNSLTSFWEKIQKTVKDTLEPKSYLRMENEKDLNEEEKQTVSF